MRQHFVLLLACFAIGCQSHAADRLSARLLVEGLNCKDCPAVFKHELGKTEGVAAYQVDVDKGEALVTYDPQKTDIGGIGETLANKGFKVRLEPWVPIDAMFEGCANGFCGSRRPNAAVTQQPGAAPGHSVYCPVSGVLLRVKDTTLKADMKGQPVYVCCKGCLRYFRANRAKVLALRKLLLAAL